MQLRKMLLFSLLLAWSQASAQENEEFREFSLFPLQDLQLYPSSRPLTEAGYIEPLTSLFHIGGPCFWGINPLPLAFYSLQVPLSCRRAFRSEGFHLAPEITPELRYDNKRPHTSVGINTALSTSLQLPGAALNWRTFAKVRYKFASSNSPAALEPGNFDTGALQFFNDVLTSNLSLGLLYYPVVTQIQHGWIMEYFSTLPLSWRKFGRLRHSKSVSLQWLRLGYRRKIHHFVWGVGISYGKGVLDPLVFEGFLPNVFMAYSL